MFRWLHVLTIWLLMASLPLQGMAASSMPACPPDHHAAHGQMHAQTGDHADAHRDMQPSQPHYAECGHGHGSDKCCSAMCSAAAFVPQAWLSRSPGQTAVSHEPLLTQLYQGVTPEGLDRPPKQRLN